MPPAAIARFAPSRDLLELVSGLAAVTSGVLWYAVYLLTEAAPELCSATPRLLSHCALCYPAAAATLTALAGGMALLWRRSRWLNHHRLTYWRAGRFVSPLHIPRCCDSAHGRNLMLKAGGDNRDANLIVHGLVHHSAEDEVDIRMSRFANDAGRLIDLIQAQVVAAGHIEQDAPCAVNGHVKQAVR